MITKTQLIEGLINYVETEMITFLEGSQRFVSQVAINLAKPRAVNLLEPLLENKTLQALGIVSDTGLIDIDAAYNALKQSGEIQTFKLNLNGFGKYTVKQKDIDALYRRLSIQETGSE